MGYIRHHAIVVTSENFDDLTEAHKRATSIFPAVSPMVAGTINGSASFLVPPDGSKEGWSNSDEGDKRRAEFLKYLQSPQCWCDWVEVEYGGDDRHLAGLQTGRGRAMVNMDLPHA